MNRAAQSLGRLARGVPKNYSAEEIARRSKILEGINARKRKASKAKKRRMPNAPGERPGTEVPGSLDPVVQPIL